MRNDVTCVLFFRFAVVFFMLGMMSSHWTSFFNFALSSWCLVEWYMAIKSEQELNKLIKNFINDINNKEKQK